MKVKLQNHLFIFRKSVPIILANASVPLLGLVETATIGRTGSVHELGAIALGTLVFNFVYWGFGFLRMGTTGFTAQALGAKDDLEISFVFIRAWLVGFVIGLFLILFQYFVVEAALWMMNGSEQVESLVGQYFLIRIWGAPATLSTFVILGSLIGLGRTTQLLWVQLVLNGVNILLNILFVLVFGWGIKGAAFGTVIAEWITCVIGVVIAYKAVRIVSLSTFTKHWSSVLAKEKILLMLNVNANIMLRTFALLAGFAWFANQGAKFGDVTLASNHILLQFVSLSAFFLDGYAYVLEMLVGKSLGALDWNAFRRDVRNANQLAAVTAFLLALLIATMGNLAIENLTHELEVRVMAKEYLPYASFYVLVSFYAFQLDGIFIGATRTREMRNASVFSFFLFLTLGIMFVPLFGNQGLWIAFIVYVLVRGMSLRWYMPQVKRSFFN
ncbi:MATE family efflux transporter [Olivibacter sp. CPCC 100613]|uniref:MATE family efflux transporter n=1 Tax=Olivibacter sp. CPCC 100613 TaxID=3079931 RepID=UPI002FF770EE